MARKRDNLPPLPTGAARNKWEAHCRKLNLERQVTRQGNPEAYHAAAMLLGMKYSIRSHTFYKPREGYTDPATKHNLLFFHPDTLAPLTGIEVSQRRENIEEFGDAEHKNGS